MSTGRPRPWHNPTPLPGFEPEWAGQFDTFNDWVDYATKALTGELGTVGNELSSFCVDAKGRRCSCGADFMRARDEDAFPVRYFWTGKIIDLPADERLDEIRRTRDIAQQSLRVIPDEMKHIVQSLDAIPGLVDTILTARKRLEMAAVAFNILNREKAAAIERAEKAEAKLNSPELHDFAAGVVMEAAHQRERWGSEHDEAKGPDDWFWLVAHLATKARQAITYGDHDKALHHMITTAAALANWHARLTGSNTEMRPGVPESKVKT